MGILGKSLPAGRLARLSITGTSRLFVANIKSQIKRNRTNEAARLRNKSVKSSLKTAIRHFREAADSGDREKALAALQTASRKLDKAAGKGVIHANQAANKKSAMAQRANSL
jgi:small subunit ribosomal protein S20